MGWNDFSFPHAGAGEGNEFSVSLLKPKGVLTIKLFQGGKLDLNRRKRLLPKILASKSLARSWRLELVEDELKYAEKPSFPYVRVKLPESAIVLATRKDGKIPLVRQYRHGAGGLFWELPAGYIEEGESALGCMKREFKEEVGHELQGAKEIGVFYLQPSRSNQLVHVFIGQVGKYNPVAPDSTESIESRFYSRDEVWKLFLKKSSAMHVLAFLLAESERKN